MSGAVTDAPVCTSPHTPYPFAGDLVLLGREVLPGDLVELLTFFAVAMRAAPTTATLCTAGPAEQRRDYEWGSTTLRA